MCTVGFLMCPNELHNQDYCYYQTDCNERNCPKKSVGACRNSPYWELADHVIRIYLSTLLAVKIAGQSMKSPSVRKTQIGAEKHRGFYFGEEILLTAFWTRAQELPSRKTHVLVFNASDLVQKYKRKSDVHKFVTSSAALKMPKFHANIYLLILVMVTPRNKNQSCLGDS
jgi:hypothetical protein